MHLYYIIIIVIIIIIVVIIIIIIIIGVCHQGLFNLHGCWSPHLRLCRLTFFFAGRSVLLHQIGDTCIIHF